MKLSFKLKHLLLCAAMLMPSALSAYKYQYESYERDPMSTLVYTLPNGLKVYMSVNKEKPRIQTNIAVRVGSKNDPPETTGLAHYFEHMMFKGTRDFGTSNYYAELPLLNKIEQLFEVYRATSDTTARAEIYHLIDSISYEASKIAIPNEYDKLMAGIGASGTNAYTSQDYTCYVEDIPSNEIERWAKIQANRFEFPVLRGFHTELETIYEEKNMSLTKDNRKMTEGMMQMLFPNHPYGQWSVLGHQNHLKNPSITNIKEYHKQWYVPNNMAILMAGDFNPDEVVDIITKYFGHLKPNPNLPSLPEIEQEPIVGPQTLEVWGNEAEALILAWAFPGATDPQIEVLQIVDAMLNNGKAGLIDINLNKQQKTQGVSAGMWRMADRTAYLIQGSPKEGQTLEEVQALILEEVAKLRAGDFDESMIRATINNYKLYNQSAIEDNDGRVSVLEDVFVNGFDPQTYIDMLDRQSKLTKSDIVDFANKYLRDDNFVAIYKRQGEDKSQLKIAKQPITPIVINRDTISLFLTDVLSEKVEPIEPVFIDFDKDLTYLSARNGTVPVLYTKNDINDIFTLSYYFEFGSNSDKELAMLNSYFPLLGTAEMTTEDIARKFYEIACSYGISVGSNYIRINISGLSENMPQAIALLENIMAGAKPDAETYSLVADRLIKARDNSKKNQASNFSALQRYAKYGPEQLKSFTMSNDEIRNIDPKSLTDKLASLNSIEHQIIYHGPMSTDEVIAIIDKEHNTPATLTKAPEIVKLRPQKPAETIFYIAPYDSKQLYMAQWSNKEKTYDPAYENMMMAYNEYFGGGMNSIVFQELREARSLAYSAWAVLRRPSYKGDPYEYTTMIATQNDKLEDAVTSFEEIIENMPISENAFNLTKDNLESSLRTERVSKENIPYMLLNNRNIGREGDYRKSFYEALPSITLDDVADFQKNNIKGATYYYSILGKVEDLDLDFLRSRGKVVILTTDEIFGY